MAMEAILFFFFIYLAQILVSCNSAVVHLDILDNHVVIDNEILQVNISKPEGQITGIRYNGNDNLLQTSNKTLHGGWFDLNWNPAGAHKTGGTLDSIEGTIFKVIVENKDLVELSFTRPWDPKLQGDISPLSIDKRIIVLSNSSGFYSYAIFEHSAGMPAFNLNTARIAFILNREMFHYMVVADDIQRSMPDPDDRSAERSEQLAYKEAVRITKPIEPEFTGEVDDKYEYTKENKDNMVHGWISLNSRVGFWQITPSNEFRTGGPFKQDLTSHVGPATLAVFVTSHYAGLNNVVKFKVGEVWKKVFGPVFVYLNTVSGDPHTLWDNAKEQMKVEVERWPPSFAASNDFPKSGQRGTVSGRFLVKDMYLSKIDMPAKDAYIGLALPGDAGSWQRENKGYQFWTKTDKDGYYTIKNVRVGEYNLFASAPGFIGDYRHNIIVNVTPGSVLTMSDIVYEPPRDGPTLWEIGYPDRSAVEFFVPDPNPLYINKLFVNHTDRFRQYGLWESYADLHPKEDLEYTIGTSDFKKDWFYAHVTRKARNNTYTATTWQIKFELDNITEQGTYKLRLALASAHVSELQVRVNDANINPPIFSTRVIGKDNAIARHGIHGIYWLFNVDVPSSLLVCGNNTIYLTQAQSKSPLQGIMYDYIRLEGPSSSVNRNKILLGLVLWMQALLAIHLQL